MSSSAGRPRPTVSGSRLARFSLISVAAGMVLVAGSWADVDDRPLVWKLLEGDEFYVEQQTVQQQTVTVGDAEPVVNQTRRTVVLFYHVNGADAAGRTQLRVQVVSSHVDGTDANAIEAAASALVDSEFLVWLDANHNLVRFDGYDRFARSVSDRDAESRAVFDFAGGSEAFGEMLTRVFAILPRSGAAAGESWSVSRSVPVGMFGTVSVNRMIKREDVGDAVDAPQRVRLKISGEMTIAAPDLDDTDQDQGQADRDRGDNPGATCKFDFDGFSGNAIFDFQQERIVETQESFRVRGSLSMETDTAPVTARFEQTVETVIHVRSELE